MSEAAKIKRLEHLSRQAVGLMAETAAIHAEVHAMAHRKTVSICPCQLCHEMRQLMDDIETEINTPVINDQQPSAVVFPAVDPTLLPPGMRA